MKSPTPTAQPYFLPALPPPDNPRPSLNTVNTYTYTPSLAEVKNRCAKYGYTFTGTAAVSLARPRGDANNSPRTITAETRRELTLAVQAAAVANFADLVDALPETVGETAFPSTTRAALVAWYNTHGREWLEKLRHAWFTGNYGYSCPESSTLQQLRNTNGREIVETLANYCNYTAR